MAQTFTMELYEIHLNNGIITISGSIDRKDNPHFHFQSASIISRVYGRAEEQLAAMLFASQRKVGTAHHAQLPASIEITVDDYGKIINAESRID